MTLYHVTMVETFEVEAENEFAASILFNVDGNRIDYRLATVKPVVVIEGHKGFYSVEEIPAQGR